jgi:AhpD family alkylhydroperoxidase
MDHDHLSLAIREDLAAAIERAWRRLAGPGTCAGHCRLCRDRTAALSPSIVQGEHDDLGVLPPSMVDVIHRLAADSGRLTESWYLNVLERGISDCEYVETVSVVNMTVALDTFDRAIGAAMRALPAVISGAPVRRRPRGAKPHGAWVPTVRPEDLTEDDPDPYARFQAYNIQLALGLVPQEVTKFFDLDTVLYLTEHQIADLSTEHRAVSRAQMELIATRGAAVNGCHYCATCHSLHLHKLGQNQGLSYDLEGVLSGAATDNGVEQGALLVAFVNAVLGDDDDLLAGLRRSLHEALSGPSLVDAAATVASFNSIVRVANATGTRLDRMVKDQIEGLPDNADWVRQLPKDR